VVPKFGDRPIVMIEQGVIAKAAFDAIDGTIDSMTKPRYFLTANRILIEKRLKNNGALTITSYAREGEI
jgi:hypothetical protein